MILAIKIALFSLWALPLAVLLTVFMSHIVAKFSVQLQEHCVKVVATVVAITTLAQITWLTELVIYVGQHDTFVLTLLMLQIFNILGVTFVFMQLCGKQTRRESSQVKQTNPAFGGLKDLDEVLDLVIQKELNQKEHKESEMKLEESPMDGNESTVQTEVQLMTLRNYVQNTSKKAQICVISEVF